MGAVIPAGFAQIAYATLTTGDSEEMLWTCGLDVSGGGTAAALLDDLKSAWDSNILPITSSVVSLSRILLKYGPVSTGPAYELPGGELGTDGGSLPPPNCAVLVQKHTGQGGRKGRGRVYLPGISSISGGLDSAGNFTQAKADDVTTAMEGWRTDITAGDTGPGGTPVLLHSDATTPYDIESFVCVPKLATQRRRLRP
jgi:hypothetical protein